MDKIILCILMLQRLTVYEIRGIIKKNFTSMCSDSMGSIQAAIKKLLAAGMVTCSEYVEKSVNKKRYSITNAGRKALTDWLQTPADLADGKNMELGKLLFMGLVPAEKRLPLVDEMIAGLEKELSFLLDVQDSVAENGKVQAVDYWSQDPEYCAGIQKATQNPDMMENANGIGFFQIMTLQYGISNLQFNIEWLKALRVKMIHADTASSETERGGHPT